MSINLPTHYVQQYGRNVNLLLQQRGSKLAGTVSVGKYVGKQASPADQIGAVAAQRVTTRFGEMPRIDAPTDRRWVFPVDYDLPQLVDNLDQLRMINDPKSALAQNAAFAMGRAQDDEIIGAFFASAKTGESGGTTTTFPAGNQIAVNHDAAGNTGLTVTKLREAKRLLLAAEVDLDMEQAYVAITAKQHDDLLSEIQVISDEFNKPVLGQDGMVRTYMGFQFKLTERLDVDANSYRRVPVWVPSGMHMGVWNDIQSAVSIREDLRSRPYQLYTIGTFGATRMEEDRVIEIKCSEV